ncbi:MAG: TolC family protein [Spirochaetia bacterium]|jgi:outer membrane protein TolC|nr:TolC family protein [Spirochaetia bacterium]
MSKKILALLAAVSILMPTLAAQKLTVDQAVENALTHSLTIQTDQLSVEAAKIAQDDGVTNTFYPTLQATTTIGRSNSGTKALSGMHYIDPSDSSSGMAADYATYGPYVFFSSGLSFSLSLHPSMWESLKLLKYQIDTKQISLQAAKKSLALQIRQLYFGIVVQEEALKLQQQSLAQAKETLANMQKSYEAGLVPEINLYQLKNQIASSNSSINSSEANIASQKQTLNFLMGTEDIDAPIEFVDGLPAVTGHELDTFKVEEALAADTDLQNLNINEQMLDSQESMTKSSIYCPSVTLSASYQPLVYDVTTDWSTSTNHTDQGSISATLAFNVTNMLPGSSSRTKLKTIANSRQNLEVGKDQLVQNIRLTFSKNLADAKTALEQMDLAKTNIALAQKTLDLTKQSYENGLTDYASYRDAQLSHDQAKLNLLQAQYTYFSSVLKLQSEASAAY